MSDSILVALIVGVMAVIGQQLQSWNASRSRREDKEEDWARQDEVADKLVEQNEKVAKAAGETKAQLKEIHTLVNSNMTAAMQAQLVALKGQLVLMERLAERTVSTEDELAAIKAVQGQISELEAALRDRLEATEAAAAAAAVTTTTTTVTK